MGMRLGRAWKSGHETREGVEVWYETRKGMEVWV